MAYLADSGLRTENKGFWPWSLELGSFVHSNHISQAPAQNQAPGVPFISNTNYNMPSKSPSQTPNRYHSGQESSVCTASKPEERPTRYSETPLKWLWADRFPDQRGLFLPPQSASMKQRPHTEYFGKTEASQTHSKCRHTEKEPLTSRRPSCGGQGSSSRVQSARTKACCAGAWSGQVHAARAWGPGQAQGSKVWWGLCHPKNPSLIRKGLKN